MIHLWRSGLLPHMQVVGTSLDEHTRESFIELARKAIKEHGDDEEDKKEFDAFAERLFWADDGDENLMAGIAEAEADCEQEQARLHYLSVPPKRSEEHTSELQSLMRTSYAVFCLKKKHTQTPITNN